MIPVKDDKKEVPPTALAHPSDGAVVRILIEADAIQARVTALGAEIRADLGEGEITLLCILKGSYMFLADLSRAIQGPVSVEFLGVQSYGDETRSTGAVKITHDLTAPIQGKSVVVVEDIVDTGLTLEYLTRILRARNPQTLKICSLLEKPSPGSRVKPDYVGFSIGNHFVVGYGLDWAGRHRNLPYVGFVEDR